MCRSKIIYEVSSFSHGKRYSNDLPDADNMLVIELYFHKEILNFIIVFRFNIDW